MLLRSGTILVTCFLAAGTATSVGAQDYTRPGLYLGIGAGYAMDMAFADELQRQLRALGYTTAEVKVDGSAAVNARVGTRASQYLSMEVQGEYLPGLQTSVRADGFSPWVESSEQWIATITANLKVSVLSGRWQPFAIFGGGLVVAGIKDSAGLGLSETEFGGAIRAGGGLDIFVTEHLSLAPEVTYVVPFGDVEKLDYLTVGGNLTYHF